MSDSAAGAGGAGGPPPSIPGMPGGFDLSALQSVLEVTSRFEPWFINPQDLISAFCNGWDYELAVWFDAI
eukprot:scaffold138560_cov37-Prasinocladus_malaysianus.AAC.1